MMGLSHGVGVTHLCIMMANYLVSGCGQKTAVLEWAETEPTDRESALQRLEAVCMGKARGKKPYRVLGVDYYCASGAGELASCIGSNYERIILDFGCIGQENQRELLRCDQKLIVVSLSEWQIEAFWQFYGEKENAECKSWSYLVAFGSEETRKEMNRRLKLSFLRIPLSIDAFAINREMMTWFYEILTHCR
ncbi:MAG: hypothetical protein RSB57_03910 [Hungatella sp.]